MRKAIGDMRKQVYDVSKLLTAERENQALVWLPGTFPDNPIKVAVGDGLPLGETLSQAVTSDNQIPLRVLSEQTLREIWFPNDRDPCSPERLSKDLVIHPGDLIFILVQQ